MPNQTSSAVKDAMEEVRKAAALVQALVATLDEIETRHPVIFAHTAIEKTAILSRRLAQLAEVAYLEERQ